MHFLLTPTTSPTMFSTNLRITVEITKLKPVLKKCKLNCVVHIYILFHDSPRVFLFSLFLFFLFPVTDFKGQVQESSMVHCKCKETNQQNT